MFENPIDRMYSYKTNSICIHFFSLLHIIIRLTTGPLTLYPQSLLTVYNIIVFKVLEYIFEKKAMKKIVIFCLILSNIRFISNCQCERKEKCHCKNFLNMINEFDNFPNGCGTQKVHQESFSKVLNRIGFTKCNNLFYNSNHIF